MSLSSIRDPGVFHSETAGPRSLTRSRRRPWMRLPRTTRRAARPGRSPSGCPRAGCLPPARGRRPRSRKMPEFLAIRLRPDPLSSARGLSRPGAVPRSHCRCRCPAPPRPARPRSSACCSPRGRLGTPRPRWSVSPGAGAGAPPTALSPGLTLNHVRSAPPRSTARPQKRAEQQSRRYQERATGSSIRPSWDGRSSAPDISICRAWQNH